MSSARNSARGLFAAGGSVVAALVASACCWIPFLLVSSGAATTGLSARFERVRPYSLGVTALFLGLGFYLVYFKKEQCAPGAACAVPNEKLQRINRGMLWIATVAALVLALFPNYVGILANPAVAGASGDSETSAPVALNIEGMACEACSIHVNRALEGVAGVLESSVDFEGARAQLRVDSHSRPSIQDLVAAVEEAGYEAAPAEAP
ncbi:MAG: hypothetical protein E2O39_13360 [Planctomycetota bacterium]|nr:MAG: hypothetical protein E2O39_13360 [Planctomycetota bacterium]